MRRKLLIVAGVIVVIFGVLAALPFLYKDKLLAKVKTTLNNQVNAKIDFSGFSLSLFSQFPKVEMEIRNLSLVGINEFASDTIFSAGSISTNISLMEMISGKGLELNSLTIENPRISLISDKSGKVNWDIAKTSVSGKPEAASAEASTEAFKMKLSDVRVNNLNLLYNDMAMPMKVWVRNTNISSSGDVAGTVTSFNLKGDVGEFIFEYDSVKYISKTKLKAETGLKVDYEKMDFAFDQGKLWINNLPLEVNGSFSMPNDSMHFDLAFQSEKSDFATILSLVPADYQKYLEKADIKGSAEFKGSVKGLFLQRDFIRRLMCYFRPVMPVLNIRICLKVFRIFRFSAQITKPEGDLNLLKVNVEKAHASIKKQSDGFAFCW